METEVFVQSLGLWSLCLIEIDNVPQLSLGSVASVYLNWGAFTIIASFDIKHFLALPVDELVVLVLEDLPPVRVGTPNFHLASSSITVDFPGLVVVSGSNGQGLLMEVPHLGSSSVWNLDNHVPVVDEVEVSVIWEC